MVALARGGETFYRNYWELAEQVILELDEDLKGWIVIDNILRKAGEEVTVKPAKEDISIRIKNLFFGEGEFSGYSRKERKKLIEKWVERGKKVEISDMEINAEKSREIWFYNFKNITFKDIVMKDAQVLGNKSVNNEFINIKMKSSRLEFTDLVTNTHFKNIKMTGESEFSILPSWHLEESEIINRKNLFEDIDFGGCKVKIDTENSIFKNVDFSNANIDVSGFKKCKFIGCSFRNAKITTFVGGPVFRKCIFINKNVEESFKGIKNMDTDLRKDGEETKKMIKKGSKKALFKECEFRERA
jgi:uncharacterized protein YjbI with pentapeptide repeats